MKKINLLCLLFLFALVSCNETKNDAVNPSEIAAINVPNPVNFSALIVGKWQLSEIGMVRTVSSGSCGNNNTNTHDEVLWSTATTAETLDFKESGDFTKDLKNDGLCKGTYQISYSNLMTKSDCGQADGVVPIEVLNKTEMTLVKQENNERVKYKYVKL